MLLKAKLKEIEKFKKLHTFSSTVLNNSLFKNFVVEKIFVFLIFGFLEVSENIFTPKISGFTVHSCQGYKTWSEALICTLDQKSNLSY